MIGVALCASGGKLNARRFSSPQRDSVLTLTAVTCLRITAQNCDGSRSTLLRYYVRCCGPFLGRGQYKAIFLIFCRNAGAEVRIQDDNFRGPVPSAEVPVANRVGDETIPIKHRRKLMSAGENRQDPVQMRCEMSHELNVRLTEIVKIRASAFLSAGLVVPDPAARQALVQPRCVLRPSLQERSPGY